MSLLESVREMNKDGLVEMFDQYSRALYKYAIQLCDDSLMADHIVGDVFAKILDQLAAGNGPSTNLRSYLFEMAYHQIVDEVRSSHRKAPLDVADSMRCDRYAMVMKLEHRFLMERIRLVIANDLSEDQRHVVILRFMEGFSLRETAAIMGKNTNSIKAIENRALVKLRGALCFHLEM